MYGCRYVGTVCRVMYVCTSPHALSSVASYVDLLVNRAIIKANDKQSLLEI